MDERTDKTLTTELNEAIELALDTLARNVTEELRLHDENYGDEYFENLKYAIRECGDARVAMARADWAARSP